MLFRSQGPHAGRWDNSGLIEKILALRHEAAGLVGFRSFAEYSLATKMAESPERVIEFLRDLARRSKPVAEQELAELSDFAGQKLEPWDTAYYAERLRQQRLDLAEEELRPYFPLPRVLDGLFGLLGTLLDLKVREATAPSVWHDSVRYYELERADGTQLGSIQVAQEKARTALLFKRPTKVFEDAIAGGRQALLALHGALPLEGGLPIMVSGQLVGAIGVSGVKSTEDAQVAKAGIDALGL